MTPPTDPTIGVLADALDRLGREWCADPRRVESLLLDLLPGKRREAHLLVIAVRAGIAGDLVVGSTALPVNVRIERFVHRLHVEFSLREEAARWAVETWAAALGLPVTTVPAPARPKPAAAAPPTPATPSTAPDGRPLVVAKLGADHFRSIGEALAQARPGSTIVVQPGVYNEEIVLDKPAEIVGAGDRAEIVVQNATGGSCLVMRADYAVVRNLSLRGRADVAGKRAHAIDVALGRLVLEDCDVTSSGGAGISVHGPLATPCIRFCTIHDVTGAAGVVCRDRAEVVLEDCELLGNADNQVFAHDASLTCRRCLVHDGAEGGICVSAAARAVLEDCRLWNNRGEAVVVEAAHAFVMRRCSTGTDGRGGVSLRGCDRCLIEDCELTDEAVAFSIGEASAPVIRRCACRGGRTTAVAVRDRAAPTLEDCEISPHPGGQPAVTVAGNARASFTRCRIQQCGGRAVVARDRAEADFRGCQVRDAGSDVVRVDAHARLRLEDCAVQGGAGSGLVVAGDAAVEVLGCRIVDNRQSGVGVEDRGHPRVRDSIIGGNDRHALRVGARAAATVTGCDLSDNGMGAWEIDPGATVRRQGNRIDGVACPAVTCGRCGETFESDAAGVGACPRPECGGDAAGGQAG